MTTGDAAADNGGRQEKRRWPQPWMGPFLEALAVYGTIGHAAQAVGVARSTVYVYREDSAEFAAGWQDALDQSTDAMEKEAYRRAVEGIETPRFSRQGEMVGTIRSYSDVLLIFMLKARRPAQYRDRWLDQPAAGGKALADMTLADLAAAAAPDDDA